MHCERICEERKTLQHIDMKDCIPQSSTSSERDISIIHRFFRGPKRRIVRCGITCQTVQTVQSEVQLAITNKCFSPNAQSRYYAAQFLRQGGWCRLYQPHHCLSGARKKLERLFDFGFVSNRVLSKKGKKHPAPASEKVKFEASLFILCLFCVCHTPVGRAGSKSLI